MVLQIIEIHKQRETFDFLKPNLADINELINPVNSKKEHVLLRYLQSL